jgi:hypothetical protein
MLHNHRTAIKIHLIEAFMINALRNILRWNSGIHAGKAFRILSVCMICGLGFAFTCTITKPLSERDKQKQDYQKYKALWNSNNPHNYSYILRMECDSCSSTRGKFGIRIRNDTLDSVGVDTSVASHFDSTTLKNDVLSIEKLFVIKIEAGLLFADDMYVRYNQELGYPESTWFDYDATSPGDEYAYAVDSLAADSVH